MKANDRVLNQPQNTTKDNGGKTVYSVTRFFVAPGLVPGQESKSRNLCALGQFYLRSFLLWVYALINSNESGRVRSNNKADIKTEGKHGRDKPGYNLTTPTLEHAEDFGCPRYLIAKRADWKFLTFFFIKVDPKEKEFNPVCV